MRQHKIMQLWVNIILFS